MPSNGGAVRQVTQGDFHHRGNIDWSKDGQYLFFSANRNEDWEYDFRNSELYRIHLKTGDIKTLTAKDGPDRDPTISPDGTLIAYLGYEDKR